MFERFLTDHRLMYYIHLKEKYLGILLITFAFLMFGGLFIIVANSIDETKRNFKFLEYERVIVISSTMEESDSSARLYMRAKVKSGQTLTVSTKAGSLFAVGGQKICLKVYQSQINETQRASIVSSHRCAKDQ